MSSNALVIERILELGKASTPGTPVVMDEIYVALRRDFEVATIREAILGTLDELAELEWHDRDLDVDQRFLLGCCLHLTQSQAELAIEANIVSMLVRKLDPLAWSSLLRPCVARCLNQAELLDSLTFGIREAPADWVRSSCLEGVKTYFFYIEQPSEPAVLLRSLVAFELEVRRLRRVEDALLAESVESARRACWSIRRRNPALPKPAPNEFKAYRVEDTAVAYEIERVEDGDLAIDVLGVKLQGRLLVIEFEVFDPALLPEDAPAVIEETLLRNYALGTFRATVDEVEYVDRGRHGTVTRLRHP